MNYRKASGPARLIACAVAFFVQAGVLGAQESAPPKDWLVENSPLSESVDGIDRIVVINHQGTVRLNDGASRFDGQIISQRARQDARRAEAKISRDGSTLRVELIWQGAEAAAEEPELWQKRRIDLGVAIPPGLSVEVATADGDIHTKKLKGPLEARTENGKIMIRGSHPTIATSRLSSIHMILEEQDRGGAIRLSSTNGNVRLDLLAGSAGSVSVATRGPITTDYSIEIRHEKGSTLKKGVAQLDIDSDEAPELHLESAKGAVRLRRLLLGDP